MARWSGTRGLKAAVATVAVAVALSGCGGDDGPSAADYAAAGNAACEQASERAGEIERPSGDSADAVAGFAKAVLPIARERLAAFRELEPTEEDERFHERLLVEQDRFVAAVGTVADAAARQDRSTAHRASEEGARATVRSMLLFRELGLTRCAGSPF